MVSTRKPDRLNTRTEVPKESLSVLENESSGGGQGEMRTRRGPEDYLIWKEDYLIGKARSGI